MLAVPPHAEVLRELEAVVLGPPAPRREITVEAEVVDPILSQL